MPIYFSNTLNHNPFQFDSIGNNWTQEAVRRTQGYPQYHYLQTEEAAEFLCSTTKNIYCRKDTES